jgi:hypothetical protein
MLIIITDHARARIVERVGCKRHKIEKLVWKAWKYGTDPNEWFLSRRAANQEKHSHISFYRVFMGVAFTFVPDPDDSQKLILTTCLHYNRESKPVLPHGYIAPLPEKETPLLKKRLKQAPGE